MRRKYKMTGCARFFIVLIILTPLAYIGASYYNNEDPIENIKGLLGIGADEQADNGQDNTFTETDANLEELLEERDRRIRELEKQVNRLENQIREKDNEIESLKRQLDTLQ